MPQFQEIDTVMVASGEEISTHNLTGLWDCTEYLVAIRCISVESKLWSEWCKEEAASTEEKGRLTI